MTPERESARQDCLHTLSGVGYSPHGAVPIIGLVSTDESIDYLLSPPYIATPKRRLGVLVKGATLNVDWQIQHSPFGDFQWLQLIEDGQERACATPDYATQADLVIETRWTEFIDFLYGGLPFEEAGAATRFSGSIGALSAISGILQSPDSPRRSMLSTDTRTAVSRLSDQCRLLDRDA